MIIFKVRNEPEVRVRIASEGYTIRGYAKEIGISHPYLSQVLNGTRNPSPGTAKKLQMVLK